jgi:hypothetical protein
VHARSLADTLVLCLFLGLLCIVFDSIGNAERQDGVGIEPHELLFYVGVENLSLFNIVVHRLVLWSCFLKAGLLSQPL